MFMATILAAGAASCAGYIIGNLAVKKSPARQPVPAPRFRSVHHLPPRRTTQASAQPAPATTFLQAGVVPAPKRVMPGQCYLCESWFQHGDVVAKLYCGHVFHRQCMETFARQPIYENFRCTCIVCRGGSWITRFAVTEINPPAAPSVAPFTPVAPPPPVAPPAPVAPPPPVAPHVPVLPVTPPAPVTNQSVLTDLSSTSTNISRVSVKTCSHVKQVVPVKPQVPATTSKRHTYISLNGGTRPSCTLCPCMLCVQNNDGNCGRCGRCLCYECMYANCECCCSCIPEADGASCNDFVPLY